MFPVCASTLFPRGVVETPAATCVGAGKIARTTCGMYAGRSVLFGARVMLELGGNTGGVWLAMAAMVASDESAGMSRTLSERIGAAYGVPRSVNAAGWLGAALVCSGCAMVLSLLSQNDFAEGGCSFRCPSCDGTMLVGDVRSICSIELDSFFSDCGCCCGCACCCGVVIAAESSGSAELRVANTTGCSVRVKCCRLLLSMIPSVLCVHEQSELTFPTLPKVRSRWQCSLFLFALDLFSL